MRIRELRILPALAIGRLGSAPDPLESYVLEDDPADPTGFRRLRGAQTLVVDDATGAITRSYVPKGASFKQDGRFRPVAPFLEVHAMLADGSLEPLTPALLAADKLSVDDVQWRVQVANRKVERRTGDPGDAVEADTDWFGGHDTQVLEGHCPNFVARNRFIDFGRARFIRPNDAFPGLRLRFTPAKGLIYGTKVKEADPAIPSERAIYDPKKGKWYEFEVPPEIDDGSAPASGGFWNETLPPSLFAIVPPAPPWLHGNVAKSRGYFDDACDGIVEVRLSAPRGVELTAVARVTSGPPTLVPDSRFVRTLADDLEQVLHGPSVAADEPVEVTQARAADIVRRACETVRFLNIEVMNGADVDGRPGLSIDTMPAEEAFDTSRLLRPVFSQETADTQAVVALHQQVYAALRGGAAPWFVRLLRRPEEAGDYTDRGRRKMPALMCGADGGYLALTHRMIDTIDRAGRAQPFAGPIDAAPATATATPQASALTPRNLTAQLHFTATGNPDNVRIDSSVANCTPGLEVDFRAVWRRMFEGVVLREYDNLVVDIDPDVKDRRIRGLKHHRLLRIAGISTTTQMIGPSPADADEAVPLSTENNPHAIAALEWSNALAHVIWTSSGKKVACDFSPATSPYFQQPFDEKDHVRVELKVRPFFEPGTVVVSRALARPGELTQGLCSPWQNDYRECSCYYWASARPDFVNVEVTTAGRSAGDNWMQKERSGRYVPDDYADERLVNYDDLFLAWERWLRVQVGGRDAPGETK